MNKPVSLDYRNRASEHLYRAAAAHVRSFVTNTSAERAAKDLFGTDEATELILKASTGAAKTTTSGWADTLAHQAIDDSTAAMTSLSAATDVISRGTKVNCDSFASIRFPGRSMSAADAGNWVAEGAPIPNRAQAFTSGVVLTPQKTGRPGHLHQRTGRLVEHRGHKPRPRLRSRRPGPRRRPTGNAGRRRIKPVGILNGVTPITATAGGSSAAMVTDIAFKP
jgi:hypothetical protein